jgi:hypothetical protein
VIVFLSHDALIARLGPGLPIDLFNHDCCKISMTRPGSLGHATWIPCVWPTWEASLFLFPYAWPLVLWSISAAPIAYGNISFPDWSLNSGEPYQAHVSRVFCMCLSNHDRNKLIWVPSWGNWFKRSLRPSLTSLIQQEPLAPESAVPS